MCQIFRFDLTSQPALHLRRVHLGLTPDCGVVQGSAIGYELFPISETEYYWINKYFKAATAFA